ncbi:sugar ABC transporter ATP-binding protein [Ohessyouella blattaphilus]|uniref:Sugar ABC transporter ATP-binding protein n=1 Tax=Ohessyouella blattaphilus TaxID=2949333 RepID=A0ABT1EIK5_9FIRM|nr:sugar ABC transporter ATP-binding protein [Ohessyouella blattaphilus]MCP1110529.1 sugar ABC transporter ATP-binding protein [Ohessyouella blattaphilus]MCR8563923.1 sugar ABC transporter ATP-binding protein [Ohessyouella blattaphilus]
MIKESLIVSMQNIKKSFGGVHALTDGKLELREGEVLGLIGENGAGKSTLMKILSGVFGADSGVIEVGQSVVDYKDPSMALEDGICMIYQELNLVQKLSIADNIFIGREAQKGVVLDRKKDIENSKQILEQLDLDINPNTIVEKLPVAKQQMIEIAKGISYNSKVLIMDEPTAALAVSEIEELFRIIRKLKEQGISIIYISHRLEELFTITDRITVMRDGAYIKTFETCNCHMDELIHSMVGREVSWEKKEKSNVAVDAETVLEVEDMESPDIHGASFKLRRGEIIGFGGLMGAGRTELARLIFGADWRRKGKVYVKGKEVTIRTPNDAVMNGIGYISEDRKDFGLSLDLSIADNIALPNWELFTKGGVVNHKHQYEKTAEIAELVSVKMPSVKQLVRNLSGGNQQKVVIAKWLLKNCDILIFDEPTRGIDVGAKSEIYDLMRELIKIGKSIIMISSEMPELLGMSDRIIVMREGYITGELGIEDTTQEKIMELAVKNVKAGSN